MCFVPIKTDDQLELCLSPESIEANAKRLSRRFSAPLDDDHALIVNTIVFANLAETIVFFHGIFQQSVADFLCRLAIALTHHPFKLLTFFFVAAIVDPIGIEQENVPWTQQPELGDIGGIHPPLPEFQ